ncbi:MAG: D-alanyl-D-alanine carboxypeptidase/D-alanyl-D-alanine-endopeptidase [candidate division WOR-3 bacterium]
MINTTIVFLFFNIFAIDSILNCPELAPAHYGLCFLRLDNDSIIYSLNAEKVLTPASNVKLITTAASLYYLTPDFCFKTRLALRGSLKEERLLGDILLIGGGDPLFSLNDLERFVRRVKNLGIKEITGNIIVVDNYFTSERLPMGWSWHYLDARYAPEISALSLNQNCVKVRIKGTMPEEYAEVKMIPETDYVQLINRMRTSNDSDSIIIYRKPEANIIYVDGKIKKGSARDIDVAVKDPSFFTGVVFRERLLGEGINFTGRVVREELIISEDPSIILLDSLISTSLKEMIKEINTESRNLYAEILLKTLGVERYKKGSFNEGIKALKDFLWVCGADTSRIFLTDGSGLSRYNLIAPYDLVMVLKFMYHNPLFLIFYNSLATPGKGTLGSRFNGLKDTLRAKTGTINTVSALSGYLRVDGIDYAFSMIFNNFTCSTKRISKIQDEIIQAFCKYMHLKK